MHGVTFTFIAARAKEYPLIWRKGQMKKPFVGATAPVSPCRIPPAGGYC